MPVARSLKDQQDRLVAKYGGRIGMLGDTPEPLKNYDDVSNHGVAAAAC